MFGKLLIILQEPHPQPRVSAIREGAFDVPHVIRKRYNMKVLLD
jgi:hypothetical protein